MWLEFKALRFRPGIAATPRATRFGSGDPFELWYGGLSQIRHFVPFSSRFVGAFPETSPGKIAQPNSEREALRTRRGRTSRFFPQIHRKPRHLPIQTTANCFDPSSDTLAERSKELAARRE
jgi:hypothetical protein